MTENKIKKTKDYSNGKIYIIRNSIDDRTYVGSTCQSLSQRMAEHRSCVNKTRDKDYKIYRFMSEIGVKHFKIELLEECKCENNDQLRKREGELIREYKPELNSRIECQTHVESSHKYHILHKEKINSTKKYMQKHTKKKFQPERKHIMKSIRNESE